MGVEPIKLFLECLLDMKNLKRFFLLLENRVFSSELSFLFRDLLNVCAWGYLEDANMCLGLGDQL